MRHESDKLTVRRLSLPEGVQALLAEPGNEELIRKAVAGNYGQSVQTLAKPLELIKQYAAASSSDRKVA